MEKLRNLIRKIINENYKNDDFIIILNNNIDEESKSGTDHIVDFDDDKNYVTKKKLKGEFDLNNKNSWFYIFKKNPNIFPKIYEINNNQIKLEKLDTEKAESEIKIMKQFLYDYGDSYMHNFIKNEFAPTTRLLFNMINNTEFLDYILKKYGNKEIKILFNKWINFLRELNKIENSGWFDVHDFNFGYSKNNKLKILDI